MHTIYRKPWELQTQCAPKRRKLPNSESKPKKRKYPSILLPTSGRTGGDEVGTQSPIPDFKYSNRVSAETARTDKMEVEYDLGYITADSTDLERYRQLICAPPNDYRADLKIALYGKIFTTVPNQGKWLFPFRVRSKKIRYQGENLEPPLFSGGLKMWKAAFVENGQSLSVHRFSAQISLNPTKALNHMRGRLTDGEPTSWEEVLIRDSEYEKGLGLVKSLDSNTNVLPAEATLEDSTKATARYLRIVPFALLSEAHKARQTMNGRIGGTLSLMGNVLGRLETYWEMKQPEALAFMESIAPTLAAFQRRSVVRTHGCLGRDREPAKDDPVQNNARSVTLRLGNGETITVYAKTNDRIRFEVCHLPKKHSGLLTGGYSCNSTEELEAKIEFLRGRAAKRINSLLSYLSEWQEETPMQRASSSRFASLWFQGLGFKPDAESLLEMLRINGKIAGGASLQDSERKVLRIAKSKGLVQSVGGIYYPSKAGEILTADHGGISQMGHIPDTQTVSSKSANPLKSTSKGGKEGVPPPPPICARP